MTERNGNSQAPAGQQVIHFVERFAAEEEPFAVLKAIQEYMLDWPKERVADLQKIDGGWAPFDREQNPLPIPTLGRLALFQEAVHRQCLALSQANLKLTAEIMELDEMLSIAIQFAKAVGTSEFKQLSAKVKKHRAMSKLL